MKGEHLNITEIALFRTGPLSKEALRQAARHLLICRDCRDLLPKPSPHEFLESVFRAQLDDDSENSLSAYHDDVGYFSFLNGFRQMLRPVAVVAILMILTSGLSLLILRKLSTPANRNSVALATGDQPIDSHSNLVLPGTDTLQLLNSGNQRPTAALKNRKQVIGSEKRKEKPLQMPKSSVHIEDATRGVDGPCNSNGSISAGASITDDGIRLTWDKVNNAAKYSVYVSDLEERLVDRFETNDGTSYVSKAKFERDIDYKWRLIITLKSGEVVVGDSQKFRVNESNGNKSVRDNFRPPSRSSVDIRCMEKK